MVNTPLFQTAMDLYRAYHSSCLGLLILCTMVRVIYGAIILSGPEYYLRTIRDLFYSLLFLSCAPYLFTMIYELSEVFQHIYSNKIESVEIKADSYMLLKLLKKLSTAIYWLIFYITEGLLFVGVTASGFISVMCIMSANYTKLKSFLIITSLAVFYPVICQLINLSYGLMDENSNTSQHVVFFLTEGIKAGLGIYFALKVYAPLKQAGASVYSTVKEGKENIRSVSTYLDNASQFVTGRRPIEGLTNISRKAISESVRGVSNVAGYGTMASSALAYHGAKQVLSSGPFRSLKNNVQEKTPKSIPNVIQKVEKSAKTVKDKLIESKEKTDTLISKTPIVRNFQTPKSGSQSSVLVKEKSKTTKLSEDKSSIKMSENNVSTNVKSADTITSKTTNTHRENTTKSVVNTVNSKEVVQNQVRTSISVKTSDLHNGSVRQDPIRPKDTER